MLDHELPVFLFVLLALAVAVATLVVSHRLGPRRDNPVKLMPYESGMDPMKDARQRFDVRFYLLAIAFLVFDVELLFLYPWAVASGTVREQASIKPVGAEGLGTEAAALPLARLTVWRENRMLILVEVLIFFALLGAAYIYAWRRKVFQWQ